MGLFALKEKKICFYDSTINDKQKKFAPSLLGLDLIRACT